MENAASTAISYETSNRTDELDGIAYCVETWAQERPFMAYFENIMHIVLHQVVPHMHIYYRKVIPENFPDPTRYHCEKWTAQIHEIIIEKPEGFTFQHRHIGIEGGIPYLHLARCALSGSRKPRF